MGYFGTLWTNLTEEPEGQMSKYVYRAYISTQHIPNKRFKLVELTTS